MNGARQKSGFFSQSKARKKTILKKKLGAGAVTAVLFVLLTGLSFVVLYPFIYKIFGTFMSANDLQDATVGMIPKHWTLEQYWTAVSDQDFMFIRGLLSYTLPFSAVVSVLVTFSSSLVGYGLAKFKFPGRTAVTVAVVSTLLIPPVSLSSSLYARFRYFDLFGVFKALLGAPLQINQTVWPMAILAFTCLSFRGGVFVILMRQYFGSVPNELNQAAKVDGAGPFKAFFRIILPMARSMLVVVISLSFAWQWTDTFYTDSLLGSAPTYANTVLGFIAASGDGKFENVIYANASALLGLVPLILLFLILQRKIIAGIEASGIVG